MIEIKNLVKRYNPKKGVPVVAVNDVSLSLQDKGMVFILGKSGSGKSTLLNLIGGLDKCDSGEIIVKGKSSSQFTQAEFDSLRNTYIGFIFQEYNILNEFTVGQNIALAMQLQGQVATSEKLNEILDLVELNGYGARKPNELSGGQKQRVAIARALVKNPDIILADEPTGALDSQTGKQVFETLQRLSRDKLVVIVSHDREFAEMYGDRVIELADGKIISDISKCDGEATQIHQNITVVDNNIMHIAKGYKLTEVDLELINSYIEKNQSEVIISLSEQANADFKKSARIDNVGVRQVFDSTENVGVESKQYTEKDFSLIKSRLPIKNAIKIGANSMRVKPFRLIVTVLLSAISFMMFGMIDCIASYNLHESIVNSTPYSGLDNYAVTKTSHVLNEYGYVWSERQNMSSADIDDLSKLYPETTFNGVVRMNRLNMENVQDYKHDYFYRNGYSGFMPINDEKLNELGFEVYGRVPETYDEVAITYYEAEHFVKFGYESPYSNGTAIALKLDNASDMIGKLITVDGENKMVVGIVDTNFNPNGKFDFLKDEADNFDIVNYVVQIQYDNYLSNGYHSVVFTCNDYLELFENNNLINVEAHLAVTNEDDFWMMGMSLNYPLHEGVSKCYGTVNDCYNLADDEMVLPYSYFDRDIALLIENNLIAAVDESSQLYADFTAKTSSYNVVEFVDYVDSLDETTLTTEQKTEKLALTQAVNGVVENVFKNKTFTVYNMMVDDKPLGKFKIAGVSLDSSASAVIMNQNAIKSMGFDISYTPYSRLIADITDDYDAFVKQFVSDWEKDANELAGQVIYQLESPIIETATSFDSLITTVAQVFLYVGIAMAIFAAIMMTNFIATSIVHKKREIGILRAVGARGADVFAIFFSESIIIALINWVVAIIGAIIVTISINSSMASGAAFTVALMSISLRQVALVLAISVFVALISSWLPVWKMSRKKPIDTILDK